jgi:hypothetical protein
MIEMWLWVHSSIIQAGMHEAGAWTLAMNSVALRWRVAPELVAAAVVRLLGPSPRGVAGGAARLAIFLSQDWTCPVTTAGLDVALQGWCIHTVGLGTVHRPGPPRAAATAAACAARRQHARRLASCATAGIMRYGQPAASTSGDEPTPSPRAAAVARLGPALELLARSGRRSACAALPARPIFSSPVVSVGGWRGWRHDRLWS